MGLAQEALISDVISGLPDYETTTANAAKLGIEHLQISPSSQYSFESTHAKIFDRAASELEGLQSVINKHCEAHLDADRTFVTRLNAAAERDIIGLISSPNGGHTIKAGGRKVFDQRAHIDGLPSRG